MYLGCVSAFEALIEERNRRVLAGGRNLVWASGLPQARDRVCAHGGGVCRGDCVVIYRCPALTGFPLRKSISMTFSLVGIRATTFFVAVSITAPPSGYAYLPSRLKEIQPGRGRSLGSANSATLATYRGGITVTSYA